LQACLSTERMSGKPCNELPVTPYQQRSRSNLRTAA
jgi:hypothetical protein